MLFPDALAKLPSEKPLFIHYDGDSRVELSVATFRNWVDKAANLLEGFGVCLGDEVTIELVKTAPGHWATSVWVAATWQRGAVVVASGGVAAIVAAGSTLRAADTVVCSLHPLGLRTPDLPAGCLDFAEVLAEPDVHFAEPVSASDRAWGDLTHGDIAATAPRTTRAVFADVAPGWEALSALLVAPVLGGGSTVSVTGAAGRVEEIAAQERAELF